MNNLALGILLLLSLAAQHHAPPGADAMPRTGGEAGPDGIETGHHACFEQERAALEGGEGFGMALAADRNGYPGPKHVLDSKADLKLTPEQQAAVEKVFAQMKEQALARGKEVLLAERKLESMFAENRPEAELREQAFRIASLRAELRWIHLSAHVAVRKLLTSEQVVAYQHLRQHAASAHAAH